MIVIQTRQGKLLRGILNDETTIICKNWYVKISG